MKKPFKISPAAEANFMRQLKRVARSSGHIVDMHIDGVKIRNEVEMQKALKAYSQKLTPWAQRQSLIMMKQVTKANTRAAKATMSKNQKLIAQGLRGVAENAEGKMAYQLMELQVELIKSIPLNAGKRAQDLALQAVIEGTRASEIAKELARTTEVSESDAARIARTEVARANSVLIEARSTAVGSHGYYWRNSGDASVREAHRKWHGQKLDGKFVAWDKPLTLDDGTTGHPGTFPNCRCYPEPVFND